MGNDIGYNLRHLLLDCKESGIDIQLKGDNLMVKGSKLREDLYLLIREHKKDIVDAMQHLPDAVETHYLSRLRKGREWMDECMKRLKQDETNTKLSDTLVNNMIKWARIDDELRRLYPEYRGCPLEDMGGCDKSYAPVRCQHCGDQVIRKNNDYEITQR